jgi:lactoylglutathione lyase
MKIEHLAIWCENLEIMKNFYTKYFQMVSSELYHNPSKQFTSYFLAFGENKTRIELMNSPTIIIPKDEKGKVNGFAHFAISIGSKEEVDSLTELLRNANFTVLSNPRTTGDGYYESLICDPEGNQIEVTE